MLFVSGHTLVTTLAVPLFILVTTLAVPYFSLTVPFFMLATSMVICLQVVFLRSGSSLRFVIICSPSHREHK